MRVDVGGGGGKGGGRDGDLPLSPFAAPQKKQPVSAPDRVPATSRTWLRKPGEDGETEQKEGEEERATVPTTPSTTDALAGA